MNPLIPLDDAQFALTLDGRDAHVCGPNAQGSRKLVHRMIECGLVDTLVGLLWRLMHADMRPETSNVPRAALVAGTEEATDT